MKTFRRSAVVLLLSLSCGVILLPLRAPAQIPPKRDHTISLDSARKYIKNLEQDASQMKVKGGMFHREAFEKLLAQQGVVGIRYYYAKTDDGTPTLVLVGVDSTGNDMTALIEEMSYPCPPYCDARSSLQRQP
jgi:hypothetical protein